MKIPRWHAALSVISLVVVVLTVLAIVSPGFYRVRYIKYLKYEYPGGNGAVKVTTFDFPFMGVHNESSSVEWKHKKTTFSLALWYFITCVTTKRFSDGTQQGHDCLALTYDDAHDQSYNLPSYMQGLGLEDAFKNMGDISKMVMLEFQIEMPLAMVAAVTGFVTAIVFFRQNATSRTMGLTTFFAHLIAGVLFAVVTGKATVYSIIAEDILSGNFGFGMQGIDIQFPYCVLFCGLAAILSFIFAVKVILMLTSKSSHLRQEGHSTLEGPQGVHPYRPMSEFPTNVNVDEQTTKP